MQKSRKTMAKIILAIMVVFALAIPMSASCFAADDVAAISEDAAVLTVGAADETAFTVDVDGEAVEYDLNNPSEDEETGKLGAAEYVDSYADNLTNDKGFRAHIQTAIEKVRESIGAYATWLALLPPIIAIVLALITKEVYSSLAIGIIAGGFIYAGGNFETAINHVLFDGFVASLSDSYNMGIIIFLVLLGALVSMMNKAGGSAAFGRWAAKHIKSRVGAQLATVVLGCLIFIDDYFNCLTVGSVMRPVTDEQKISRAKL